MIVTNIAYDPVRDLAPVDQFGFVDLKTALSESIVPSQMPGAETDYNGIDNPEQVLGRPRDIFEAMDTQKALEAAAASAPGNDEKSE